MDLLFALIGAVLGALVGVWVARAAMGRHDWLVSPWVLRERYRVRRRVKAGQAGPSDVGAYLRSSTKGLRFMVDHSKTLAAYLSWCCRDEDPSLPVGTLPEESEAACALLYWLQHDPDWALLVACMEARMLPSELVAHVDRVHPVTREQVEFLTAMRGPGSR